MTEEIQSLSDLLKQAEAEADVLTANQEKFEKLMKVAAEIEKEYPDQFQPGEVIDQLNELSDEELAALLESEDLGGEDADEGDSETETAGRSQETGATEAQTEEEDTTDVDTQAQEEDATDKAAGEELDPETAEKVAEVHVLGEYLGAVMWDSFTKHAAEYGVSFDDHVDQLGKFAEDAGEAIAAGAFGGNGQLDEKTAQELYDVGRLCAIGRILQDFVGSEE